MDTWQPAPILYPDAELVLCAATRELVVDLKVAYVGRELPPTYSTAIIWNRVGGRDPNALMQVRCFAPTAQQATDLARHLASRLPLVPVMRVGVAAVNQNEGPTDLGDDPTPMRQMMYDIAFTGSQVLVAEPDVTISATELGGDHYTL